MELSQRVTITPPSQRGSFVAARFFCLIAIFSCVVICLDEYGPRFIDGVQLSEDAEACDVHANCYGMRYPDVDAASSDYGNSAKEIIESICADAHLFCFRLTSPGFSLECESQAAALGVSESGPDGAPLFGSTHPIEWMSNSSWLIDQSKLFEGRSISCVLNSREGNDHFLFTYASSSVDNDISSSGVPLHDLEEAGLQRNRDAHMTKSEALGGSPSPDVEINPSILDWGQNYMYSPSLTFLTLENTCNDCVLHVYQPYSTDAQFYPCNFTEASLGPGEVVSICFVFLPQWLGLSSAHLVLQTSSGGFVVKAKGFAIESPHRIQPVIGLDDLSRKRWDMNLALFNPFNGSLHVEEITAWLVVSQGSISYKAEAVCAVERFQGSSVTVKNCLVVGNGLVDVPPLAIRPCVTWEIALHSTETIIEIDLRVALQGKVFGASCIQLQRSSQYEAVMVPLKAEVDAKAAYGNLGGFVAVSVERLTTFGSSEIVAFAISLKNKAPYPLSIVKISEFADPRYFKIKYMEGLVLFPSSVAQVAVVSCSNLSGEYHSFPPEVSHVKRNCLVLVLKNDLRSSPVEISCEYMIGVCLEYQKDISIEYQPYSRKAQSGNKKIGCLGSGRQLKAPEMAEVDELILGNWKSEGTRIGMAVLDDHELVFPMVQVGTRYLMWITVKNPSLEPVVMQLNLSSGEIVKCRGTEDSILLPLADALISKGSTASWWGFSIAESAITEAYVHPNGQASLGPVVFHPSNRCTWRSSAFIRSNISGVEWLSLRGSGGFLSLVLFEGSEPVQNIEFILDLPAPLRGVPADMLPDMQDACSQTLQKEFYFKNTGDLPVEVTDIGVSGNECMSDGFIIHTCHGFSLGPGQSSKLLISYQTDFSASFVHRDLVLALNVGVLAIPMNATLPLCMINLCKRSVFWNRLKKCCLAVFFAALFISLIFYSIFPSAVALGSSHMDSCEGGKRCGERRSHGHRSLRTKSTASTDSLLTSVQKGKNWRQESKGKDPVKGGALEQELTSQLRKSAVEKRIQRNGLDDSCMGSTMACRPSLHVPAVKSETSNLTIKIGKDKGRRRRKKGSATGLIGTSELSSQSGNSTPTSPMSPFAISTPISCLSPAAYKSSETKSPSSRVTNRHNETGWASFSLLKAKNLEPIASVGFQSHSWFNPTREQPTARKTYSKALMSPSACLPNVGGPSYDIVCFSFRDSGPPVPPPDGSKTVKGKEKAGTEKAEYWDGLTYDIWSDHWALIRQTMCNPTNDNASTSAPFSFFERGPEILKEIYDKYISACRKNG